MRILLVEDDELLSQQIKQQLITANYSVDVATDGQEGLFQGQEYSYDAAIVDIGLPKMHGDDVVKTLRSQHINFPILMLTARSGWQDKVKALDAGADDYLTKPFHIEELLARVNALIRRSANIASPTIENGPFVLNTASAEVKVDNHLISLSGHEYKVFHYFMLNIGHVISKTELTEHIYDQDFDLDSNVIEVFVRRLRKKLDPNNQYKFIETLRGQGYRFVDFSKS